MKDAKVIHELKAYLKSNVLYHLWKSWISILGAYSIFSLLFQYPGANADIHVIPKIESADSIPNLQSIIAASDGVRP